MGVDAGAPDAHYVDVAKVYEGAFFYESGPYQDWLLATLLRHLDSGSGTTPCGLRVVDLGGGTGNFTAALAAAAALTHPVLCVDNSAPMLAVAAGRAGVVPREQDAVAFAAATDAQATGYDRVLLKELVHHIPEAEAGAMYAGLARQLAPGGLAVTVTRPREVDYPLWPAARQVWRDAQPPAERMCEQMAAAGLAVRTEEATYTATMPKGRWLDMVRSRFWSTFSAFDDASLEAGIAEVEAAHAHTDVVTFNDRLLILIGTKPAPCAAPASSDAAAAGDFDTLSAAVQAALITLASTPAAVADADGDAAAAAAPSELHIAPLSLADSFAERAAYLRDGLLLRRRILSPAEAAAAYDSFQRYEKTHCGGRVAGDARFKAHLMLPWLWRLVHHPRLVALVAAALGTRHVACWSTDVFVKEPGDGALTTWHQDSTYAAMQPAEGLTAWIALTPSTSIGGAVRFLPGSHAAGQRPHLRGRGGAVNMLLAGQEVADVCDVARSVIAELAPGEASLHHLLTIHCSGANAGASRRVGIALRYMPAHVTQARIPRDSVAVVSGDEAAFSDRYAIEHPPAAECDDAGRAAHAAAVAAVHPDAAQVQPPRAR